MTDQLQQWIEQVRAESDPGFELVTNEFIPWTAWNRPLAQSKVALVSTGGVHLRHGLHQSFDENAPFGDPTFREFPSVVTTVDLAVSPAGVGPGKDGLRYASEDINVIFPLERLQELAAAGYLDRVAPLTYSFSGYVTRPVKLLANYAPSVAYRMRRMGADVALVVAVGDVGHQTAALVARAIELAGVPTVTLGTNREVFEAVRPPRAVVVKHPAASPLGNPGNAGKHQHLLKEVFATAWGQEGPGPVTKLPFVWDGR